MVSFNEVFVISTAVLFVKIILSKPTITPIVLRTAWDANDWDRNSQATTDFTLFENKSLLILKRSYKGDIILRCDGQQPVAWSMASMENGWATSAIAERHVTNISNTNTYSYSTSLLLQPARQRFSLYASSDNHVGKFECGSIFSNSSVLFTTFGKSEILIVIEQENSVRVPWNLYQNIMWNSTSLQPVLIPCFTLNSYESTVELYTRKNGTLHSLRDTDVLRVEPFIGYYLHPTAITAEAEEFACLFKNFKNNDTRMDLGRWRSDSYEHDSIENPYVSRIQGVTDNTLVIFNVTRSDGLVEDKPTLSLQKLGSNHEYSCCTSGESNTSMYFVVVGCNDPFCVTRRMVIRNLPGRVYL